MRDDPVPSRRAVLHDMSAEAAATWADMNVHGVKVTSRTTRDLCARTRTLARRGAARLRRAARRRARSACDPGAREPNLTLGLGRVPRGHAAARRYGPENGGRVLAKMPGPACRTAVASVTEPFGDGARAPLNRTDGTRAPGRWTVDRDFIGLSRAATFEIIIIRSAVFFSRPCVR